MGKKGRRREERETEEVRRYQWEFLRRNPEYFRDYEAFMAEFGTWLRQKGFWYDRGISYQDQDRKFFWEAIIPRVREICLKWQVYDLYPPDWTFDSLGRPQCEPRPRAYLPTGPTSQVKACWDLLDTTESSHEKARRELHAIRSRRVAEDSYRFLKLELDVTQPMGDLLRQVQRAIQHHRRNHEDGLEKLKDDQPQRRRLDKYAEYLEVWDLRGQGLTFEQIAQRVYPVEYEAQHRKGNQPRAREAYEAEYNRRFEGLVAHGIGVWDAHTQLEKEFGLDRISRVYNPIVQRVRDHFARSKELVEGGYKELE